MIFPYDFDFTSCLPSSRRTLTTLLGFSVLAVVACGKPTHQASLMAAKGMSNDAGTGTGNRTALASSALQGGARLVESVARPANFQVVLNPRDKALHSSFSNPRISPVEVTQPNQHYRIHPFVKFAPGFTGVLWLELYVENLSDTPLKNVSLNLPKTSGLPPFVTPQGLGVYDLTQNPMELLPAKTAFHLDRISPRGMARVVLGVPHDLRNIRLDFSLEAQTAESHEVAQNSSPVVVSRDGREVWAAFADSGTVSVLDTATQTRTAVLQLGQKPTSVAITPDNALVLVTLSLENKVVVIDRATREVLQTLTEADGLGREPRSVVVSPDGRFAYVSSYVDSRISELRRNTDALGNATKGFSLVNSIAVGPRPTALSVSPDGRRVFVAHFLPRGPIINNQGWATTLATAPLSALGETIIDDAFNLGTGAACSAKEFNNPILKVLFGKTTPEDFTLEGAPSQLAGVFLNPAGTEGWTPGTRIAGAAPIFERGKNMAPDVPTISESPIGEFTAPILFVLDSRNGLGANSLEPAKLLYNAGFERPVPKGYAKCLMHPVQIEYTSRDLRKTAPNEQSNRGTVYPSGVDALTEIGQVRFLTFSPGGRRAFVLAYGSDELAVHDALTHQPITQKHFLLSGNNPTGMALSPDGKTGYVVYANSPNLTVLDTSAYAEDKGQLPLPSFVPYEFKDAKDVPSTRIPFGKQFIRHIGNVPMHPTFIETANINLVESDPMDPALRRGKILFDSANPLKHKVSATRLGSCGGCHPDGGSDGSAWSTVEGERKTLSLRGGVAGRGWLHISGTHNNADEFVRLVVPERMGGNLTDTQYHELAAYVSYGIEKLQHPQVNEAKAASGKILFESNCTGCHSGEKLTSGNADASNEWGGGGANEPIMFDIGTATNNAHVVMGKFFERSLDKKTAIVVSSVRGDRALGAVDEVQKILDYTPRPERKKGSFKATSLVNVWDNSVFYHSGKFSELSEVVSDINIRTGLDLTLEQQSDLVEYLKTL